MQKKLHVTIWACVEYSIFGINIHPCSGSKQGECFYPIVSTVHDLDSAPDFATTYAEGRFSESALAVMTALGFNTPRAAQMAAPPITERLHKARDVWRYISNDNFALGVMDNGYKI